MTTIGQENGKEGTLGVEGGLPGKDNDDTARRAQDGGS